MSAALVVGWRRTGAVRREEGDVGRAVGQLVTDEAQVVDHLLGLVAAAHEQGRLSEFRGPAGATVAHDPVGLGASAATAGVGESDETSSSGQSRLGTGASGERAKERPAAASPFGRPGDSSTLAIRLAPSAAVAGSGQHGEGGQVGGKTSGVLPPRGVPDALVFE